MTFIHLAAHRDRGIVVDPQCLLAWQHVIRESAGGIAE